MYYNYRLYWAKLSADWKAGKAWVRITTAETIGLSSLHAQETIGPHSYLPLAALKMEIGSPCWEYSGE